MARQSSVKSHTDLYNYYLDNSVNRGLRFDLSQETFESIIKQPCYYCGQSAQPGIDRVNNTLGYIVNNVVPCCQKCDKRKSYFTLEILESFEKIAQGVRRFYAHPPKK